MGKIEDKARDQAVKHASKFCDDNSWDDTLEKYAEVFNKFSEESNRLDERHERGARIEEADTADFYYYLQYSMSLARWIADGELIRNGYKQDKHNNWILKKQPPAPPKKKFGFWG